MKGGKDRFCRCDCYKLIIMQRQMKFAEIPVEFCNLKVSDFDTQIYTTAKNRQIAETVKKIAIGYVKEFLQEKAIGKGLYLYSDTNGSGKTRMAISIGNALIKQYIQSVKFTTTINLLNEIKTTFNKDSNDITTEGGSFSALLDAAKTVEVLILDDIGTERPTAWVGEVFYAILNDRMDAKMVTLFTSNCRVEDLQHEKKIISRIARMAMPVKFPEESIRASLAKQENETVLKMLLGN